MPPRVRIASAQDGKRGLPQVVGRRLRNPPAEVRNGGPVRLWQAARCESGTIRGPGLGGSQGGGRPGQLPTLLLPTNAPATDRESSLIRSARPATSARHPRGELLPGFTSRAAHKRRKTKYHPALPPPFTLQPVWARTALNQGLNLKTAVGAPQIDGSILTATFCGTWGCHWNSERRSR